ncbi:MAG TPA: hypothetical protein VFX49_20800 [Chloroflexota bacterium]|nr:hypothetical protein [Chloroflexota bacterium]
MIRHRLLQRVFAALAAIAAVAVPLPATPPAALAAGDVAAPVLAWYYPQFSQGLATDVKNAAAARIDALIVSETGARDLAGHLAAVRGTTVHVVAGIEPQTYPSPDAIAQRIASLLSKDAADPGYLSYQGRPVIVFWQPPSVPRYAGQTAQQTWQTIRAKADPNRTSIWVAEGGDTAAGTGTLSYMPAFDALHLYSMAWSADPAGALAGWANRLRSYDASKLWVATVMPGGYYGSGSDPSQWSYRDRQNGAYYRAAWQGAIGTSPAMVIITSYNETKERTEIHPTGEWGSLYLDLTRELGDQWRARVGGQPAPPPLPVPAPAPAPVAPPPPTSRTFPETGQTVGGAFYTFFSRYGGLDRFGFPVAAETIESGRVVQWFQRAKMEYFPEHAGTPYEVQLGLLGDELTAARRPFDLGEAFVSTTSDRYYPETGHGLHAAFLRFFDARGGLESFGYPISEELYGENGWPFAVQYFQRARLEYHPELAGTPYEVQLGLLGDEVLATRSQVMAISAPPEAPAASAPAQAAPAPAPATTAPTPAPAAPKRGKR